MLEQVNRKKKIYQLLRLILLVLGIGVLVSISSKLIESQNYSTDDFFPYWAAGKLNISGDNPYDPQKKDALQIAVSGQGSTVYPISIMLYPPYAVTLVMPFGLLPYSLSRMVWLLLSIGCIVFSAQIFWRLYNGPTNKRWLPWIVILLFGPTISVLEVGQISALVLLGISLFIFFILVRENDWLAGTSLILVAIKPQVTYIFWIALLFWVIYSKRWKIIISLVSALAVLTIIAMLFNPKVMSQYLMMAQTGYIRELATPTIGAYLRYFWLGTDMFWLQFLAPVLGGFWFVYYWIYHRNSWSWLNHLPLLLLISQMSAPYTYTYDQVILVPMIVQAILWLLQDWKNASAIIFALIYLALSILDLILHMRLSDFWFIWLAPSLLIWYLLIHWRFDQSPRLDQVTVPLME